MIKFEMAMHDSSIHVAGGVMLVLGDPGGGGFREAGLGTTVEDNVAGCRVDQRLDLKMRRCESDTPSNCTKNQITSTIRIRRAGVSVK